MANETHPRVDDPTSIYLTRLYYALEGQHNTTPPWGDLRENTRSAKQCGINAVIDIVFHVVPLLPGAIWKLLAAYADANPETLTKHEDAHQRVWDAWIPRVEKDQS